MTKIPLTLLAALTTFAVPTNLRADSGKAPVPAGGGGASLSGQSLHLTFGLGSPVGFFGLIYDTPSLSRFWLQAGVGLGYSGLLVSAMPKVAFNQGGRCRVGLGVGMALGISATASVEQPGPTSVWLDIDALAFKCATSGGSIVSFGIGVTKRLSQSAHRPDDPLADLYDGGPQIHLGFGKGF
jgi:hypothetical protein